MNSGALAQLTATIKMDGSVEKGAMK